MPIARANLRSVLFTRVLIADGAMGTMLQGYNLANDFEGRDGCNEILNRTRPDVVEDIHRAYLAAGADLIETNTFGANLTALAEYSATSEIEDLAYRGAAIARRVADEFSTLNQPRFVLGSVGPGTKLPTLGQVGFVDLRDAYQKQITAMISGGIDAIQIETVQDLLQAKAAIIAAKRASKECQVDLPIFVSVTVETTGTMLLGSEIGAAISVLSSLGVDMIGLNCATGPAEMREHLRNLSRSCATGISAMPNAGLPVLTASGAHYPLTPNDLANALENYVDDFGLAMVGGCCGTSPEHIQVLRERLGDHKPVAKREILTRNTVASLYGDTDLAQETSYLAIGERTNANGSKAFREAMLTGDYDTCLDIARSQSSQGAHVLDLCVDYVGRDGSVDITALASRFASKVTLPLMIDSTQPSTIEAGLNQLPGRSIVNSVNFEDGCQPGSRFDRIMNLVSEHGCAVVALTIDEQGQARTSQDKVRVGERLISEITKRGVDEGDILVDCLTFPIATGTDETRRDGIATIEAIAELKKAHPKVKTTLGISNISFGLNPAARVVLNSVFLDECLKAGLDSAIVSVAKIMPIERINPKQYQLALDLIYDRRSTDYDPLTEMLAAFENVSKTDLVEESAVKFADLPVGERLSRRIVDANERGLTDDLDEALSQESALDIINNHLLAGMKTVGELFGLARMQLPFVLASAQTMKTAVSYLQPYLDASQAGAGKGTLVLATVKGDVHDIGKNLVDIIVSNNGYTVINLGIKQPISSIIEAAEKYDADAIGMSGLLVKSTMVMRDNLEELNARKISEKYPVILGGAALTRTFVDDDLAALYQGTVRYAKDAFEGLHLLDSIMALKQGDTSAQLPPTKGKRVGVRTRTRPVSKPQRSNVERCIDVPHPPFWGSRVAKGLRLGEIVDWLDERATLMGRWGLRGVKGGLSYEELAETEGRPRLRALLDLIKAEGLANFAVVYGYFPCFSHNNSLTICAPDDQSKELFTWTFPRQLRDRQLSIPDFFRDREEAQDLGPDVIAMQLVTMGSKISAKTAELYGNDAYRDYLELHGLGVQLTEALAEFWHHRIRIELGIAEDERAIAEQIAKQSYRGSRYSFGYGACPDLGMRRQLVELLRPERIGVELSEECQLHPEQSTDAIIVHHHQAKYFST